MAKTFSVTGTLSVPLEDGQTPAAGLLTASVTYTKKASFDLVYDATVTDDPITFGTLASTGAKGVLIKCTAGACVVKVDSDGVTGNLPLPLNSGGYLLFMNPTTGLPTGCHITVAATASLEILAVG